MAAKWEYCILTRLSAGLDTKWHVNRVFEHHETEMPSEATEAAYRKLNDKLDKLHAARIYPILPSALNMLGSEGWELIDDMNTGMPGGEGLVFKRPRSARAAAPRAKKPARRKR